METKKILKKCKLSASARNVLFFFFKLKKEKEKEKEKEKKP